MFVRKGWVKRPFRSAVILIRKVVRHFDLKVQLTMTSPQRFRKQIFGCVFFARTQDERFVEHQSSHTKCLEAINCSLIR